MNIIFQPKCGLYSTMLTLIPNLNFFFHCTSFFFINIFKIIFNFLECYKKEQVWNTTKLNRSGMILLVAIHFCITKDQGRFMKTDGSNS